MEYDQDTTRRYPRTMQEAFGKPNDGVVEHYQRSMLSRLTNKRSMAVMALIVVAFVMSAYWIIS